MKTSIKKEAPILLIVLIPFIYLAAVWEKLPEQVPLHWNMKGEIDRYGDKIEMWIIPFVLPFLIYFIMLIIPLIDPKKKIEKMGNKFYQLKLLLTTFMSALAVYIIYSTQYESNSPKIIFACIGALFALLGNYMKVVKPNYFIGIRTPWTLENETVWNLTHKLAGKLWFVGGLFIVITSLFLSNEYNFYFFISTTIIITIIPLVYSYVKFKEVKSTNE